MIGAIARPLMGIGKGVVTVGKNLPKWGLRALDIEWYGSSLLHQFGDKNKAFKWETMYTKPLGGFNMNLNQFNNYLTKGASVKTAQNNPMTTLGRIRQTTGDIAGTVGNISNTIRDLGNITRSAAPGIEMLQGLFRPAPQPTNWAGILTATLLGGGLGLGALMYKKKLDEERKRQVLGDSLYNKMLYYKYYPLTKGASQKGQTKVASIMSSLRELAGSIMENPVVQYVRENPLRSAVLAGVGGLAAKEISDMAVDSSVGAPVSDDKLAEAARYLQETDPFLANVDPAQILSALKSISVYNPHVLSDPETAARLVKQIINYGGIDINMINALTSARKNLSSSLKYEKTQGKFTQSLLSGLGRMVLG